MVFVDEIYNQIKEHAQDTFPKECCGLILDDGSVVAIHNCAANPVSEFKIHPMDYLRYEKRTAFIYHSHTNRAPEPTPADRASCEAVGKPYMILSVPSYEVCRVLPSYRNPALLERQFVYGVSDCYALVADYFSQICEITLPEYIRPEFGWWETGTQDPVTNNFERAGFVWADGKVDTHDLILISSNNSKVPSHMAVYLGSGKMMHHPALSLSRVSNYVGQWVKNTVGVLRYAG